MGRSPREEEPSRGALVRSSPREELSCGALVRSPREEPSCIVHDSDSVTAQIQTAVFATTIHDDRGCAPPPQGETPQLPLADTAAPSYTPTTP